MKQLLLDFLFLMSVCFYDHEQVAAAAAVLYNSVLALASSGNDNDDLLMEIGSAAAQAIANGTLTPPIFDHSSYIYFSSLGPVATSMYVAQ
jgi:hypothetical protein